LSATIFNYRDYQELRLEDKINDHPELALNCSIFILSAG